MRSAEDELVEIAARQRALLLEALMALVAGAGVILVHRLLDLLGTCCPRCNEAFCAFPLHLPLLLPRRCVHCAQLLDRPEELPGRTPA